MDQIVNAEPLLPFVERLIELLQEYITASQPRIGLVLTITPGPRVRLLNESLFAIEKFNAHGISSHKSLEKLGRASYLDATEQKKLRGWLIDVAEQLRAEQDHATDSSED